MNMYFSTFNAHLVVLQPALFNQSSVVGYLGYFQ